MTYELLNRARICINTFISVRCSCTSIYTTVCPSDLSLCQCKSCGRDRNAIRMPKCWCRPSLCSARCPGHLFLLSAFYRDRSVFPLWVLQMALLVWLLWIIKKLDYRTFRRMTTPSSTLVRLRYFSSSNSARSPCASNTGVLCVCHPVMVLGLPA